MRRFIPLSETQISAFIEYIGGKSISDIIRMFGEPFHQDGPGVIRGIGSDGRISETSYLRRLEFRALTQDVYFLWIYDCGDDKLSHFNFGGQPIVAEQGAAANP